MSIRSIIIETAITIRNKLMTLTGDDRLDAAYIKGAATPETGATIKAKLEALTSPDKLSADASQDGTANKVYTAAEQSKLGLIEAWADVTDTTNVLAAGAPIVISQTAAPSEAPTKIGNIYLNTVAKKTYFAHGVSASSDYIEIATASEASLRDFGICQGRLTLQSGVPIPLTSQIGKETIFFTPYNGNLIDLFNGTSWVRRKFTEISLSIASLIENTVYDIFCDYSDDAFVLSAVAWTAPSGGDITSISNASPRVASTSTPPTTGTLITVKGNSVAENNQTWRVGTVVAGTSFVLLNLDGTNSSSPGSVGNGGSFNRKDQNQGRATALTKQDGILVQNNKRYLGSIKMTDVAGQCEFTRDFRGVWNMYNRVDFELYNYEEDDTTLTNSTYYLPAKDFANSVYFVIGQIEDYVRSSIMAKTDSSADGVYSFLYCVLNSKNNLKSGEEIGIGSADNTPSRVSCSDFSYPLEGANYANILMNASASSVIVNTPTLKLLVKM